ncbi:MAG TPA: Ku protein [Paracoccaceae bacterium]|nr:Ku protein [Paracoccaceae bacterium]
MAVRASWKGHISLAELSIPVALYAAATTSQRISFHILNRETGNRVRRQYFNEETGKAVAREDQVKGYETRDGETVILDPEGIAAAVPESDKTIHIKTFIACNEVDTLYFDRPYIIAPSDEAAGEAFAVLCKGMRQAHVAALGRAVLFRRVRTLLLRADGPGLAAHTLNFDYEIRSASDAFDDLPEISIEGEMLELAKHIIATKTGDFDPAEFDDRYDQALAELVQAKIAGREIKPSKRAEAPKVVNLMDALRESARAAGAPAAGKGSRRKATPKKTGTKSGSAKSGTTRASAKKAGGKKAATSGKTRKLDGA